MGPGAGRGPLKAVAGQNPAELPRHLHGRRAAWQRAAVHPGPGQRLEHVYTSPCSGRVRNQHIAPNIDRAVFNGFANYLTAHSKFKAGVYSAPSIWADIFGTGQYASLSNTYEWTYTSDTSSLRITRAAGA